MHPTLWIGELMTSLQGLIVCVLIAAFLDDGWTIAPCYTPSIHQPAMYSFYLGGWDVIFTKVVEDDFEEIADEGID